MSSSSPFPWHGLLIVLATVVILFGFTALTLWIVQAMTSARDELRDRYTSRRWRPAAIDLLMVPLWLVLEIACFTIAMAFTLLAVIVAYQAAKGVRDWWHAGARGRIH